MEIIVLCGIYVVELMGLQLGLRILFSLKVRHKAWMLFELIVPIIISTLSINKSGKNVLVTIAAIGVIFLLVSDSIGQRVIKIGLAFIFLNCIDEIFLYVEKYLLGFQDIFTGESLVEYFILKCGTVISMAGLFLITEKKKIKRNNHIGSFIYLIVGFVAMCMMFTLAVLNYAKQFFPKYRFIMICDILDSIVYVSIFLLVIFVIYIKNTHERMERLLKSEQLLKETQVSYYRQLLKKEEDTRKYRHDMVNHLSYLHGLLTRDRTKEAENYLVQMQGTFRDIQHAYYAIGNEMIDAIMNYCFGMLPEDTKVKIIGKCPMEFDIEDTDLCTIFSNVFQNAVEEIVGNHIENAKIEICVEKGREYVRYQISNTLQDVENVEINRPTGLPVTRKKDKKNHGIGLINVKMAVERNRGKFSWEKRDGNFCVSIILPVKTDRSGRKPTG